MNLRTVRTYKQAIAAIARRHGVAEVQVFGSTAREAAGPESDLDLLVRLKPGRSLLDRAAFKADVQELLGVRVDVANPDTLHPLIRDRVQSEAQTL
jgi:uncharacterized protein